MSTITVSEKAKDSDMLKICATHVRELKLEKSVKSKDAEGKEISGLPASVDGPTVVSLPVKAIRGALAQSAK